MKIRTGSLYTGTALAWLVLAGAPAGAADMPAAYFEGEEYTCPDVAPADDEGLRLYNLNACADFVAPGASPATEMNAPEASDRAPGASDGTSGEGGEGGGGAGGGNGGDGGSGGEGGDGGSGGDPEGGGGGAAGNPPVEPPVDAPPMEDSQPKGNNGVGNGVDPQPPGNPPINDGTGTGPGMPGNKAGTPSTTP